MRQVQNGHMVYIGKAPIKKQRNKKNLKSTFLSQLCVMGTFPIQIQIFKFNKIYCHAGLVNIKMVHVARDFNPSFFSLISSFFLDNIWPPGLQGDGLVFLFSSLTCILGQVALIMDLSFHGLFFLRSPKEELKLLNFPLELRYTCIDLNGQ